MLDEQPHERELLRSQTPHPIKAELSLDHNAAPSAFQTCHNQLIASYRILRDEWIKRIHLPPLSRFEHENNIFSVKLLWQLIIRLLYSRTMRRREDLFHDSS